MFNKQIVLPQVAHPCGDRLISTINVTLKLIFIYSVHKKLSFMNVYFLPSSAQAPVPARLCWFYSQLLRPSVRLAIRPSHQNSTFRPELDFPVKSKVVRLDVQTLEISSDLNPISNGSFLTLFQSSSHLNKHFLSLECT